MNWIQEFLNNRLDKPNSLLADLSNEIKKEIGKNTSNIIFQDLENDSTMTLENFKDQIVILNLWSLSCSGCRMQIPELSKLHKEYYDEGLRVIFISKDNKNALKKYFIENLIEGVKTNMDTSEIGNLKRPYQFFATPSSFLIDRTEIIQDAWLGPQNYVSLRSKISQYI